MHSDRVDTQWNVITGAPSSGKTSVIRELEHRGYSVVHEAARAIIESERQKGRTINEIKADMIGFERMILMKKVEIESGLPENELVFLDRAIPDSIAYYRLYGLDVNEPLKYCRFVRYRNVFLFQKLKFVSDAVRCENDRVAEQLENYLSDTYRMLGYNLVTIAPFSVNQRVDMILSHLE